jgi:hypothetical protein
VYAEGVGMMTWACQLDRVETVAHDVTSDCLLSPVWTTVGAFF